MTLGTFLRNRRTHLRLTQKEIALSINVAQSTYCDWESDTNTPKIKHLGSLAQKLEIEKEELIKYLTLPTLKTSAGLGMG
ncbi:helix-turn-helix transcriptional regulator [Runella sp. MFBS21]|uniref:helix-turn-helix domain-containing protein n=1 Tax=Runella sp. MFBS21 TaxID=3034018 RepID=UPI0023F88598|nr:helix-turn-helix transcriptional regulator [Runella sp. MFBS21]MDF7819545.1 helix-turn-helix transcriptional regulator [Runella sp. MFBS21]